MNDLSELPKKNFFQIMPCKNFMKYIRLRKNVQIYVNISNLFAYNVSDIVHLSSDCNSGLQHFN